MKIIERSVQEIGSSYLVGLPKPWVRGLGIKKGTKLKMLVSEKGNLLIAPEFVLENQKKEAVIEYDSHFNRVFFREYFEGNQKIIIKFKNQIGEEERKKLYLFLKRFMNAQTIEEDKSRIVVKCFRIEELSMEECLQRMHYLCLNMLESKSSDALQMQELRDTMTRFYYLLVMQVRRFLTEGKFTGDNQISLIKAMDIRMVAEKIQRIGEIAFAMNGHKNSELLKDIKEYYSTAYYCFAKEDFQKALPLWQKGNELQNTCRNQAKNHKETAKLEQIIRYSKEISMLVR